MSDTGKPARQRLPHPPQCLRMGEVQGQGYIGQALGWADVLAVAYKHA
jgi:transketolase N-terminal domain/subunit